MGKEQRMGRERRDNERQGEVEKREREIIKINGYRIQVSHLGHSHF